MKRKNVIAIAALVMLALLSACKNPAGDGGTNTGGQPNPDSYTIKIEKSGNVQGDIVTASPATGYDGDEITLNYTLANAKKNNRLTFSGTIRAITQVDSAGTGKKQYTIIKEDAVNGVITINAAFVHSDKELDTIAFADNGNVTKPYGSAPFTRAITNTGSGTGAITYSSSDPSVATVDNNGTVTILKAGTTTITATKAADATYEQATAMYTLTVTSAQTIEVPRTSIVDFEADAIGKTYDSTKAGSAPTVKVVADPLHSGQKSLQITSTTYNQAAIVPINLPVELQYYKSFSFRFNLLSSANLTGQSIMVYVAKSTATFLQYGFGNPANSEHAQFAANLLGSTPAETIGDSHRNKWTSYTLTISNPGAAIKDLKGDIYIAIGINAQNGADYLIDDLKFEMKDDYNPPPIIILGPPSPPTIGAVSSGTYRNMFAEWGKSDAEVTAKVNNAYNKLFVNGTADEKIFVETGSDMAYIYTADTNDVRSEGMSYGMMMCVQMNDQTRFNKLWKWARTYMYNTVNNGSNNRGYFSWQCNTSGGKIDQGPAPDGEEYFITALLFAHARWGSSSSGINNYAQEARQVIYDLTRRKPGNGDPYGEPSMFNTDNYMVRFATLGSSATFTDPSYHLPAFYEVWALELENDWNNNKLYGIWTDKADLKKDVDFFKQAATTSRSFFAKTTHSTTGLGPDYANFDGTPTGGNHADFRFDAWRIAMNIGMDYAWWAADSWQKTFANRIQAFFVSKGVTSYKNQWKLDGSSSEGDHSPGLVGCNAVASLAATHENAWKFIEDFWNISMTTGTYRYYDGCLYMMCMLHLSGNFKAYLSTNTTPVNSSSITPTTATFDKKTSAANYKDIAVTMTLNGNTLTSIKNGAATLTSGTNYTVSGSTVTIKKEYLTAQAVGTTTLVFTFSAGATQNLVITVVDTSNSSISPTTATFDKRSDLQADINVTVTLNGNTLSNIKNGSTTLTSGTNYTVSGSTVTINKSYLATLADGTTTLVFTFNAGATSSLAITVKQSPAGGGTGTSYNFATDTFPASYPKYSSANLTSVLEGGVLKVKKTSTNYESLYLILPFDLGTKNLTNFSAVEIEMRGVSGDYTNKAMTAAVTKNTTFTGSTTTLATTGNTTLGTTFKTVTITTSISSSDGAGYTGAIEIGFMMPGNAFEYEIKSIKLVPKP